MTRRHNFQTISWFWDLQQRDLLKLDPPYQRRSVWNQSFKDYFIDTVLLGFPAPAVFLYEDISAEGRSIYNVVDGKQRLTSIFEFIQDQFPVAEDSQITQFRGKYFTSLEDTAKKSFWSYQFLVEYLPAAEEQIINNIFDRINRNVAKLTPQELRHARLDGEFISLAEQLAVWMTETLPKNVPRFGTQSRKQMKDVETVATLLLLLEEGPKGYSQNDLDDAFVRRDQTWEERSDVEQRFRDTIQTLEQVFSPHGEIDLANTRLRNQADFYSLFGAIDQLRQEGKLPPVDTMISRLQSFISRLEDTAEREDNPELVAYYDAARSASNDRGARTTRISIVKDVIQGQ